MKLGIAMAARMPITPTPPHPTTAAMITHVIVVIAAFAAGFPLGCAAAPGCA
jgi:hypothetical protein